MKYKDLYPISGGIFTDVFAREYPEEYAKIFINSPSKLIDGYSVLTYGDREVVGVINQENKNTLISSIISVNLNAWVKQASVLGEEYDILRPIVREIESKDDAKRKEEKTNDTTHSNKYFNDTEYEDGQKENREDQTGWEEEKNFKSVERGNGGVKLISTIIKEEIALRENNIKEKVIKDLIDEITLSIYK